MATLGPGPDSESPGDGVDTPSPARRSTVERARERFLASRERATELFERHRHRGPVDFALRVIARDRETAGSVVGSAIAFRLFLFFVPLLLFVVGLAGLFRHAVDTADLDGAGIQGTIATQIDSALNQSGRTRWLAIGFGLFGMATAGRTLSKVTAQASCLAWRLPLRSKASLRFVGTMIGLLVGIVVIATLVNAIRHHLGLGAASVSFVVAVSAYALVWFVVSIQLPRPMSDPGTLLPGALIVALTIVGMQAVSQLYLPNKFESASQLYGAIGVTIVTLGWFFIAGRAIVIAMVVDAVVYDRYGSISQFVFALPLLRQLPRRWPWFRHTFQLQDEEAKE